MPTFVASYVHGEGAAGALVELRIRESTSARTVELQSLARDLAMQVVAMRPIVVRSTQIDGEAWANELTRLSRTLGLQDKKPSERLALIAEGREAYERAFVLLKQPYVKDESITVEQQIALVAAELSEVIEVIRICRFGGEEDMVPSVLSE